MNRNLLRVSLLTATLVTSGPDAWAQTKQPPLGAKQAGPKESGQPKPLDYAHIGSEGEYNLRQIRQLWQRDRKAAAKPEDVLFGEYLAKTHREMTRVINTVLGIHDENGKSAEEKLIERATKLEALTDRRAQTVAWAFANAQTALTLLQTAVRLDPKIGYDHVSEDIDKWLERLDHDLHIQRASGNGRNKSSPLPRDCRAAHQYL